MRTLNHEGPSPTLTDTFLELTDTPSSYASQTLKLTRVNAGETALEFVAPSSLGLANSVSNADGSLTISPTTGAVVASLNVNNSNTWTATQTFDAGLKLNDSDASTFGTDSDFTFSWNNSTSNLQGKLGATTIISINSTDGLFVDNDQRFTIGGTNGYYFTTPSGANNNLSLVPSAAGRFFVVDQMGFKVNETFSNTTMALKLGATPTYFAGLATLPDRYSMVVNRPATNSGATIQATANFVLEHFAGSTASSAENYAVGAYAYTQQDGSANYTEDDAGLNAYQAYVRHRGSGTIKQANAYYGALALQTDADGTITKGVTFYSVGGNAQSGSGSIVTMIDFLAGDAGGGGTVTNKIGLQISALGAKATNNYGIRVGAVSGTIAYSLWLSDSADSTNAANGITFGSSADTNLYRSAANTLKTDDTLIAGTGLTIGVGTAATDYTLTFDGETNDGVLKWMEDEDYFQFQDDVTFADNAGLYSGHIFTNSTITVTIGAANTPTEVGDTWTTGLMNGCSFGSAHYIDVGANGAGRYKIDWTMSTSFASAPGGAREIEVGVMIDGVAQVEGRAHRTMANTTDTGALAGTCILDLAASKQVSLYINNIDTDDNVDVEHANLSIVQIGG